MRSDPQAIPQISPLMWRWFSAYAGRFLRRHFHAVRLSRAAAVPSPRHDEPLVVYANHPSWWDPMIAIFLAQRLWPGRRHYFPIDAAMLARYRFFARLGFFGVEPDSARGAANFLRSAGAILASGNACLWVTAQGRFADVRQRPIELKAGLAHLARRAERGHVVPLAVEYPFWTERTPEALLRFGTPIDLGEVSGRERPVDDWQILFVRRLTDTMDALASDAIARDAAAFETLLTGATGTSAVYDAWRRLRALARGRRFDPSHVPEPDTRPATEARAT